MRGERNDLKKRLAETTAKLEGHLKSAQENIVAKAHQIRALQKNVQDLVKRLQTVQATADATIKNLMGELKESDRINELERQRLANEINVEGTAKKKAQKDLSTFMNEQNRSVKAANALTHQTRDEVLTIAA